MRLVFWIRHQPFIALLIFGCLMGMGSFFWYRSLLTNGTIDIDRGQPLQAEFKLDINAAEWSEFVVLPGVGQKLARAIVERRKANGPFVTLDEIQQVPGIGEKKFHQLKPYFLPLQ